MKYTVLLSNHAEKDLLSLPADIIKRIDGRLQVLSSSPYPGGIAKLKGKEGEGWRIRVAAPFGPAICSPPTASRPG